MKVEKRLKFGGFSSKYGVTFFGRKYTVASYRDINGEIKTIVKEKDEKISFKEYLLFNGRMSNRLLSSISLDDMKIISPILIGVYIFLYVLAMICLFEIENLFLGTPFFYIFYGIVTLIYVVFLIISLLTFKDNDYEQVVKYHGAEHKVANAFDKNGFVPDLDEIKKCSRYHSRCGISILTNRLFVLNIFYIISIVFKTYMPPLSLIYLIPGIFPSFNPYSYIIQMLYTTKEPTDKELEVAKRAYKRLLELETGETYIYEKEFTSVKKMRLANEISNYHIDDDYIDDVIDNLIDEAYDQYIIEEVMLP